MSFPRSFLATIFVLSFLGFHFSTAAAQDDSPTPVRDLAGVIEECEKSVVRIEVQTSSNGPIDEVIGSGFVADSTGIIATNAHVLKGVYAAKAVFPNGKSAKILGTLFSDTRRDICIVKIETSDLPTLKFAEAPPRKGEKVVALGCPVGLSFSATVGVVSAVRGEKEMQKDLGVPDMLGTWIQVDAALSPGNSGGPLINEVGEVVAMSTLASVGIAQNLNFGISATDIRDAVKNSQKQTLVKFDSASPRRAGKMFANQPNGSGGMGSTPRSPILRAPSVPFGTAPNTRSGPFTNTRPQPPADGDALEAYVESGRQIYSALYDDLQSSIRVCELDIESFRIDLQKRSAKNEKLSEFEARDKKEKLAANSAELIRLKKIRDSITEKASNESLFKLLQTHGPQIDLKSEEKVGLLGKCHIVGVMSDEALFISMEGMGGTGLLWIESTIGYQKGQYINFGLAHLTGYEPTVLPPGFSASYREFPVFLLADISELKAVIFEDSTARAKPSDESFRTWTDLSGKFKVEAVLVNVEGDSVRLRRRDGIEVTVPKSKLSNTDRTFLNN